MKIFFGYLFSSALLLSSIWSAYYTFMFLNKFLTLFWAGFSLIFLTLFMVVFVDTLIEHVKFKKATKE